MNLGKEVCPDNKLLPLDGRGKTHLAHKNERQHEPIATGSLFWAIQRTAKASEANLSLEMYTLAFPQIKLTIPGHAAVSPKVPKGLCPGIPILKNMQAVPANTRLVALHDPVMALATEREVLKRKAERQATEEAVKAQAANAARKS